MTPEHSLGDQISVAQPRIDIHNSSTIPETDQPSRANTPLRMPMQIHDKPTDNGRTNRERSHCGKEEPGVLDVEVVVNLHQNDEATDVDNYAKGYEGGPKVQAVRPVGYDEAEGEGCGKGRNGVELGLDD